MEYGTKVSNTAQANHIGANTMGAEEKQGHLIESLKRAENSALLLHTQIDRLESKLQSVLSAPNPQESGENQKLRHSAPAVAFVDDLGSSVYAASNRLSDLIERLTT